MASWKQEAEVIDPPQSSWRDDAVPLDPVERAKASPLSAPTALATPFTGLVEGVGGMMSTVMTPFWPERAAEISAGMAANREARRQRIKESGKGTVSKWVHLHLPGAIRSVTQAAAMAPLGGSTAIGRSLALAGGFGATTGTDGYHEGLRAGMSKDEAIRYGAVQGTLEGGIMLAFQGLGRLVPGLGGMEEAFTRQMAKQSSRELLKGIPKRVAAELTENEIAEILQAYNTAAQLPGAENAANWQGEDGTFWTSPMWQVMQDTASETVLAMGLTETATGASRLRQLKAIRATEPKNLKRRAAEVGITGTRSEVKKKLDERIQAIEASPEYIEQFRSPQELAAEQEIEDARRVRGPKAEVRKKEGREDIRGEGEEQVREEPAGEVAPASEVPVEPTEPTPAKPTQPVPKDVKRGIKKVTPEEVTQWMNESKVDDFDKWVRSTAKGRLAGKNFTEDSLRKLWDQSREALPPAPQPIPEAAPVEETLTPAAVPEAPQEAAQEPEATPTPYSGMNNKALVAEAKKRGLKGYSGKKKAELIEMLEADDKAAKPAAPEAAPVEEAQPPPEPTPEIAEQPQPAKPAETEEQRKLRESMEEARVKERAKKREAAHEARYWKDVKKRAPKGTKGKVKISLKTKEGETRKIDSEALILDDTWAIARGVAEIDGKTVPIGKKTMTAEQYQANKANEWGLVHRPTGLKMVSATQNNLRQLYQMIQDAGVKVPSTAAAIEKDETLRKTMKELKQAWDNSNLSLLPDEMRQQFLGAVEVPDPGITAGTILDSADLEGSKAGVQVIKNLTREVPEFGYDPTFIVDNDKKLVFRDHYTYRLEPSLFNLEPGELTVGQSVGINLPDLGMKKITDKAEVIRKVLKQQGYRVSQGEARKREIIEGIQWDQEKTQAAVKRATAEKAETAAEAAQQPEVAKMAVAVPTRQSRAARRKAEAEKAGIAEADIKKTAERLFGVAIREGGFSKKAAGIYKWIRKRNMPPGPEVVRTEEHHYANLAVLSHEIAHHVDEKTKAVKSMPNAVRDEVKRLDYELEKGRAFEGWAEFLRRYMTEPPIDVAGQKVPNPALDAPQTLAWFENTFLPANKDVAKPIEEFRQYAQQFAQQSVFQRIATLISDRKPQDLSFNVRWKNKARQWLSRLKTTFVDKFHTLEWIQEEAKGRGHEGVGIYDLTMAHFLSASSHATVAFEEGVRSLQTGKPIGKTTLWGLRDHLESDGEYSDAVLYALARHTVFMDTTRPGYNTGMDIEDAESWIAEVEASGKRERYENFAKDLAAFNNDLIHMLVDAGALSPDHATRMLRYYGDLNYFPLHRVQDAKKSMFAGAGVGFVNLGRAVPGRSQKGSGRQIVDPIDATVAMAIRFYGRAIQARQQHVLAETLDPLRGGVGGMGGLMDRVDPRKKVTHGHIAEILTTLVDEGVIEADDAKAMRIAAKILNPEGGLPGTKSLKWFAERHGLELPESEEVGDVFWADLEEAAQKEPDALAVISLWRPDYTPSAIKRTVMIYDKQGNPLMYEMDHDLYSVATGMDDLQFGPFVSMVRAAARYFKTGAVGISTGFGSANLLRDYWEFQGKARHTKGLSSLGKPPVMLGRYVAEKAKKLTGRKADDQLIRLYEESGGKVYSVIGHDVHGRRMYRRRRIGKSTMSKLGVSVKRPLDTAEGALQGVQDVIAISDAPPRLADAEAAIKEEGFEIREGRWFNVNTGKPVDSLPEHVRIKAAVAMAEATINFKRIGSKGQYIEAFMPFFNATVQAMYRQYRQFKGLRTIGKKDPEGMRAKRYVVYLSALAATGVLHWLLRHEDDDWREQDPYLRDGYWTWGQNGKTYGRIPKPRDTAVVCNIVENMLDAWYHDDARSTGDVVLRDLGGRLPTGGGFVRGAIETYIADYDTFRQRSLTPDYLKKLPKEQQVTSYTTRASDAIGQVTGRYLGTSPIQVEHLLNSASGGFYRRMADLYDASAEGRLGPEHVPFLRGLLIDRHQARSVNTFYEERKDADIAARREEVANGVVSDETIRELAVLEGHAELMATIRKLEEKVGKRRGYEYQPYIVGLARHSLGYDELKNNPNPLTDATAPDAIQKAAKDYSMRAVYQASSVEKAKEEYESEESYEATRRQRIRGEAKTRALGVSHDKAQKLLLQYFRRRGWKPGTAHYQRAEALAKLYGKDFDTWWENWDLWAHWNSE